MDVENLKLKIIQIPQSDKNRIRLEGPNIWPTLHFKVQGWPNIRSF